MSCSYKTTTTVTFFHFSLAHLFFSFSHRYSSIKKKKKKYSKLIFSPASKLVLPLKCKSTGRPFLSFPNLPHSIAVIC